MQRLFTTICCCLALFAACAQAFSDQVSYITDDGSTITLRATASADNKKDAEILAAQSAFNALMHSGIPEIKGGVPMVANKKSDYDYRLFNDRRYVNYVKGEIKKIDCKKIANKQRATVQLTILLDPFKKNMEQNHVALNPQWQDGKAVKATAALNPSIVVVPYVEGKSGDFQAMKDKIDNSPLARHLIGAVAAEFTKRGYKTRDFTTMLQNSKTNDLLQAGTQSDLATKVAQQLPGDIVVTVNADVNINAKGQGECALTINAVEKQTAGNLANASYSSGLFMRNDSIALAEYALKKIKGEFFSTLNNAFANMVDQGREVVMELTLSNNIDDWDFEQDSPETGDYFKDTFDEWLRAQAHKGNYQMDTNTDKYIRATVNVPLWNVEKDRSYTLSNFASDVRKFFKAQLGDNYKANVSALGQRINIIIE